MKANTARALAVFLAILTVTTATVITDYSGVDSNPICSSSDTLSLVKTDLKASPSTTLNYDYTTTYLTSQSDSAPLLVREGDGTNGFKFIYSVDSVFTSFGEVECTGTKDAVFVGLLNKLLVLVDGTTYKVCKFNTGSPNTATVLDLTIPIDQVAGTPTYVVPFFFVKSTFLLYMSVSDGTDSAIYSFDTSASGPVTGTLVGAKKAAKVLKSIHGNADLYYNHIENQILATADETADATVIPAGSIMHSYRLRDDVAILTAMGSDRLTGSILKLKGTTVTAIAYTDTTTAPFREFCDSMSNYVLLGTTSFIWFHQRIVASTTYTATVPLTEVSTDATGAIQSIGLSGDKAVVIYADKIINLKITGDDTVKRVYETTDIDMTMTGNGQVVLSMKCMCQAIVNTACFSSTLACLVLKVASTESCFTRDPFKVPA